MAEPKKSTLTFDVEMDENNIPEKIIWNAENQEASACKAMMTSLWDDKEQNTLRMDLWTKDMMLEEMRHFFVQSLITMSDTYERATNDSENANEIREFGKKFGEKLGVIKAQ